MRIGVIGAGRMGTAIIEGLLEAGLRGQILAYDINYTKLEKVREIGTIITKSSRELAQKADVVLIAVKPNDVASVVREISAEMSGKFLVSVAAAVSIKNLLSYLGNSNVKIVRVMPNIACKVREGVLAYCTYNLTEHDEEIIREILSKLGKTVKLSEDLFDAVTGLSGSGPAYFYFIMKSLIEAGIDEGIPSELSRKIVIQLAKGSAKMVEEEDKDLDALIDMVCSPKGTTIEGLNVLKEQKVYESIKAAVKAAIKRSREISAAIQ